MTACEVFDCGMPAAGVIFDGINPDAVAVRFRRCASHLKADIDRRIELRLPFAVAPWSLVAARNAA